MIPTRTECLTATKAYLGDESGDTYTDAILAPFLANAFRKLTREGIRSQHPKMLRLGFYNVPINTNTLDPATAGLSHFGELISMDERATTSVATITGAVTGTGLWTITASGGHAFATGYPVQTYKIGGVSIDINDEYVVTVSSGTVFTLNGCTATGTYTGGGVATYSTDAWVAVEMVDVIEAPPLTPGSSLTQCVFRGGLLHFYPASAVRQVRIQYWMSGNVPTTGSDSMGIDDSLDFLAQYTAALAAQSRGENSTAASMLVLSGGAPGATEGSLQDFLDPAIRGLNRVQVQQAPYRSSRALRY